MTIQRPINKSYNSFASTQVEGTRTGQYFYLISEQEYEKTIVDKYSLLFTQGDDVAIVTVFVEKHSAASQGISAR